MSIELILLEKVPSLGDLGDLVKVKNGYARNFLIPQKKAKRASPEILAQFQAMRGDLERQANEKVLQAQRLAEVLSSLELAMHQLAGVDGRLFGSVSQNDISLALKQLGHEIPRARVKMPDGHIKTTGIHHVQVELHADVVCDLKVAVTAKHK